MPQSLPEETMEELHTPLEVVIVGGSLAGLFSGIILLRCGHNVTILERSPLSVVRDQGAGIGAVTVHDSMRDSLKSLGTSGSPILDFMEAYDRTKTPFCVPSHDNTIQWLKRNGQVKHSIKNTRNNVAASTSWDLLYNILRANFDGWEAGYVRPSERTETDGRASYMYNVRVTDIREKGRHDVWVEYVGPGEQKGSMQTNLVIGADGASSTIRTLFLPEVERTYAGYVAWRGTVKYEQLSPEARDRLRGKSTLFYARGNQAIHYEIPGLNGSLAQHERLLNFVWYSNYTPNSPEFTDLLTDTSGTTHRLALGAGKMRPEVVGAKRELAASILPPQHSSLFAQVSQPFVQAVTDSLTPRAIFLDGKVLVVGDAVAGHRPHTGAGTCQAALHALLLARVLGDKSCMSVEAWEEKIIAWAAEVQKLGVKLGELSQFGRHPMAEDDIDSAQL